MSTELHTARAPAAASKRRKAVELRLVIPFIGLPLLLCCIAFVQPRVLSYFGATLLLQFSTPLILAALAQMCILAAGDVDLGIGPFVSLINCICATWLASDPMLGVVALAVSVCGYAAMGALVQWRALPSIVVTLGASFVWLGLALWVLPSPGGAAPAWLAQVFQFQTPFVPMPIVIAVVSAFVANRLLMHTAYGSILRGVGGNPRALRQAGWSVFRARVALYACAGVCGVLAGMSLTGLNTTGDPWSGNQYTLLSIASAIVGGSSFSGGIVSPAGAVAGAITMLLSGSILSFLNVSTDWQLSLQGGLLILVLTLRSLYGEKNHEL
ncbi:ABC transporter permease [Pararobbsia silviterrae]|uniref:ABC transporter permease n=1 Tax=Pararobbsia silviterrae TaxID=1792498 RepID=A0A494XRN0_9BURK|nr:ABC transporter permease [Pararobbsia silviterrae]RKP53290.1 ABC transporter permease [Pararobbsia silviterrae]